MLAYVFWHWRDAAIVPGTYQEHLRSFHQMLAVHKPEGFRSSMVLQTASLPWIHAKEEVYEDWYLVDNSAALDLLDQAAISDQRKGPHDRVAQWAAGGTGGLYRLRAGKPDSEATRFAFWFARPPELPYADLYQLFETSPAYANGCLWQRQMTLGPALEFCWHAPQGASVTSEIPGLSVHVTTVWQG